MEAAVIRKKYLEFFKSKGHAVIPSAPLLPDNDPTVLFITAGMHPLVPYLLGEKHPAGSRLVDCQKCVRTDDIEEVGDFTHHTFFEMLGNWSLGDYFKQEAIEWSFEFLTDKKWLGLDARKLYVSIFEGDEDAPFDDEAVKIWQQQYAKAGIKALVWGRDKQSEDGEFRIFPLGKEDNWWGPAGETGPCGPDTEIFYYRGQGEPDLAKERPGSNDDNFIEIWNDVFMEYNKKMVDDGQGKKSFKFEPLQQKNVDTGMGLERITSVLAGEFDDYKTDLFEPVIKKIEAQTGIKYGTDPELDKSLRVIADHVRAAVFMIGDGVLCSNVDQGYILRRLIRRAVRHFRMLGKVGSVGSKEDRGLEASALDQAAQTVIRQYGKAYPELKNNEQAIKEEIAREEAKFIKTLEKGLKRFEELAYKEEGDNAKINGKAAFDLYQTYGFPLEMVEELAREKEIDVDRDGFQKEMEAHQRLSREGARKKFKGGLADTKGGTKKLHTAAHLMLRGLKKVLGDQVKQRGSNITVERLRFDFSYTEKLTEEQVKQVEDYVNAAIEADVAVEEREMSLEEARKQGAEGIFDNKYGDKVKVFTIGKWSSEICGGPHAKRTGELGKFKITKQESVGAGVRRIKAILS